MFPRTEKNLIFSGLLLLTLVLHSCTTRTSKAPEAKPDMHNSRISLDWAGVYTGTLPCADCEGIQTMLQLKSDQTYVRETIYNGKSPEIFRTEGDFQWNADGNSIQLQTEQPENEASFYKVGENSIIQLDLKGNRITGDLAYNYVLTKDLSGLTEKYWKLFELQGKPVSMPADGNKEAFLMLKAVNNAVSGNGGCNVFFGTYLHEEINQLRFSQMGLTRMACPGMDDENKFMEVLEKTDGYTVSGDTLILKASLAPLAKFVIDKGNK